MQHSHYGVAKASLKTSSLHIMMRSTATDTTINTSNSNHSTIGKTIEKQESFFQNKQPKSSSSPITATSDSVDNTDEINPHSTKKKSKQMKFIGIKQVQTKPISIPLLSSSQSQQQLVNEFFINETNRNLLFPNNNAETLNLQELKNNNLNYYNELISKWNKEAQLGGGYGPNYVSSKIGNDIMDHQYDHQAHDITSIFQIDALLQMPGGLKIISESTIGMKLILPNTATNNGDIIIYPEYQFTLLDSNLIPSGPTPLVWMFNKLTKYRDSTSSFTKVRIENGDNFDSIMFVTDARLETRMHLPPKLLKLLPNVNVEKFERQGSEAVQKLLEKELEPALNGFCDAFCNFMKEKKKILTNGGLKP